jgi:transglutaminase/protease-like cytokinesis protein 3
MTSVTFGAQSKSVEDTIFNAVQNHQSTVDISSYNLTPQQAVDAYNALRSSEPLMWSANKNVDAETNGTKATSLIIKYDYKSDEVTEMQSFINKTVDGIVAEAKNLPTDKEKARYVYDYLIDNYNYDFNLDKFSEYDLLKTKNGVCTAFAITYKDAMTKLGIPCEVVTSKTISHEWNIIQIDGYWYNVDAAWGDSSDDKDDYFLKSDFFMSLMGHKDGVSESGARCDNTIYDLNF